MVQITLTLSGKRSILSSGTGSIGTSSSGRRLQDMQMVLIDVKDDHKDYPKLPVVLVNNEKVYVASDGENYQTCKAKLRKVLLKD
jgi:hypothetical protein